MTIDYGSVCSGIESVSVAVHPLGWTPAWFSEIEPFPSAVLAHRFPEVPNHGDMTLLPAKVLSGAIPAPSLLVGGTPCQAFSVAGMRAGLEDPRGKLTIKFVELADAIDHVRTARGDDECTVWWENVPGVLSDKGNAFGCFLGALVGESSALQPSGGRWTDAGCVYGPQRTAAWRVLDAQYFGLAQRRRRVFVVASARRGFDPAAVLFESEGLRRDTPPRRGQGQDLTGRAPFGPAIQCGCGYTFSVELGPYGCPNCEGDEGPGVEVLAGVPSFSGEGRCAVSQAGALLAKGHRGDMATETFCIQPDQDVAGTLQSSGKAAGSATQQDAEAGLLVVHGTQDPDIQVDQAHPLGRNSGQENAVLTVSLRGREGGATAELGDDVAGCLRASSGGGDKPHVLAPVAFAENSRSEVRLESGDGQIVGTLSTGGGKPGQGQPCVAVCVTGEITHTLKAEGFDASEDGTGRGQPIITHAIQAGALRTNPASGPDGVGVQADHAYTLEARAEVQAIQSASAVRRLTPRECERLQGFPDDWTLIPYRNKPAEQCPDGPRYKAIGNSKAVFCVRWIARRIDNHIQRLNP